jgi:hypothetical protein
MVFELDQMRAQPGDRALQINAWHMLIYDALHVHCPAWSELQNRGQN